VDEAALRARLLARYSLEIGAGLGALAGKVWRIGLMGYSSRPENVLLCLSALGSEFRALGLGPDTGDALAAAQAVLHA
jgi:alanine-glyoxylate transaminase/serine-glyoxylate transaminase/serine-pyruvate transaminase